MYMQILPNLKKIPQPKTLLIPSISGKEYIICALEEGASDVASSKHPSTEL
jgi:hypothetical protein